LIEVHALDVMVLADFKEVRIVFLFLLKIYEGLMKFVSQQAKPRQLAPPLWKNRNSFSDARPDRAGHLLRRCAVRIAPSNGSKASSKYLWGAPVPNMEACPVSFECEIIRDNSPFTGWNTSEKRVSSK